jgi:hypothetical protein
MIERVPLGWEWVGVWGSGDGRCGECLWREREGGGRKMKHKKQENLECSWGEGTNQGQERIRARKRKRATEGREKARNGSTKTNFDAFI